MTLAFWNQNRKDLWQFREISVIEGKNMFVFDSARDVSEGFDAIAKEARIASE